MSSILGYNFPRGGMLYIFANTLNGKQYVGQSINLTPRIKRHVKNADDTPLGRAIRKYGTDNFHIIPIPCQPGALNHWEQYLITTLGTLSPGGYNLTTGGDRLFSMSDETRGKIGAAQRGRPKSAEWRMKMSAIKTGRKLSEEHIRRATVGRKNSPKWNLPRRPLSPEARAKISIANTGRRLSDEAKKRIGDAHRGANNSNYGKPRSPETREKIRQAHLGMTYGEETRQKLRESAARRERSGAMQRNKRGQYAAINVRLEHLREGT